MFLANIINYTGGLESDTTNLSSVQMRIEWKVVGPVDSSCLPAMYYLKNVLTISSKASKAASLLVKSSHIIYASTSHGLQLARLAVTTP